MAIINMTGFETGLSTTSVTATPEGWLAGTTSSVQSTTTRGAHSDYALKVNPAGSANGYYRIESVAATGLSANASVVTSFIRFYFMYVTKAATDSEEIFVNIALKFHLRLRSDGTIGAYTGSGAVLTQGGTTVLSPNTWYVILVKAGTGAAAAYEVKIAPDDGSTPTVELSGTSNQTVTNSVGWGFGKITNRNNNSVEYYYDDIIIDDTAYPALGKIVRLDPRANGTYAEFGAGAGTGNYLDLDDLKSQAGDDGDTTYLVTATINNRVSTLNDTSSTAAISGTINAVMAIAGVRDESAIVSWRFGMRTASDNYLTASDGNAVYEYRAYLTATDPADAGAWTTAKLDTVQPIVQHQQAQARNLRCTAMAIMVDATVVGGSVAGFSSSLSFLH